MKTYPSKPAPGQSLVDYWSKLENHNPRWALRAQKIAELCPPESIICDIGCGGQALRDHLPSTCTYLPADLTQWTPDTELCDLNLGELPINHLKKCDVCTLLGVLEYIWEPTQLLKTLHNYANTLIFTYNVADWRSNTHPLWVNNLTLSELASALTLAGYGTPEVIKLGETAIFKSSRLTSASRTYQSHDGSGGVSDSFKKLERLQLPIDLSGKRVLDIGCNEGFFCKAAADRGAVEVIGIDLHKPSVDFARARYGDTPVIKFLEQSWDVLPQGGFDVVIWSSAMHYASDPTKVANSIFEVLSPGGLFVLECGVRETYRREMELVQRYSDSLWYPSMPFLLDQILAKYSVRRMTQGEKTGDDPIPRFVFHCRQPLPTVMLLRGEHGDGKTALSMLLTSCASKVISLDLFLARMGAAQYSHSNIERFIMENMPSPDLQAVYNKIDEANLSREYAELLSGVITGSDQLVLIEGSMTDVQAFHLERALEGRAVVWDVKRRKSGLVEPK